MVRRAKKATSRELLIIAGLGLLIIWLIFLVISIAKKERIARNTAYDTKGQLAVLEERKNTLSQNIDELNTDRGQEAALRQTYGVARPGEDVIIVVPPKELPPPPELSLWQKFLRLFK